MTEINLFFVVYVTFLCYSTIASVSLKNKQAVYKVLVIIDNFLIYMKSKERSLCGRNNK